MAYQSKSIQIHSFTEFHGKAVRLPASVIVSHSFTPTLKCETVRHRPKNYSIRGDGAGYKATSPKQPGREVKGKDNE